MSSNQNATTAKLGLGEDTILRSKPRKQSNGMFWLDWSYQPIDGSKRIRRRSKGATVGEARMRARETLEGLKTVSGGEVLWKPSSDLVDYIKEVSHPAIQNSNLSRLTIFKYESILKLILGKCDLHTHRHSTLRHTIVSGTRYKALENLLTEIAGLHGRETARQTRGVFTKYVLTKLVRDELINGNPIAGVSLDDLTNTRKSERTRGGKALTLAEYEAVLEYLLNLDPSEGVGKPQGRWTKDHMVNKRRNAIDLALLQAVTGLRSNEANMILWDQHVGIDDQGQVHLVITADIAKGGIPRVALVLDSRVAQRLLERQKQAKNQGFVIGSPANNLKPWDYSNRNKATRKLYLDIAKNVGVPVLTHERSHVWRTTLHTLFSGNVPLAVLDSQFGNSEKVRAKHYTDASDLSALSETVRKVRGI